MHPVTLAEAMFLAMGVVLVVGGAWNYFMRSASAERRAAVMPLVLAAGFFTAYAFAAEFPRKLVPELWQTPVFVGIVAALLAVPALLVPRWWVAVPLWLIVIVGGSLWAFWGKLGKYWEYPIAVAAFQLVMICLLRPVSRGRGPASALPLAFAISAFAAGVAVFYAVDQRLGGIIIIFAFTLGGAAILGLFKFGEYAARGVTLFATAMLTVMVAIAAFYYYKSKQLDVPMMVFPLMLLGPFAAAIAGEEPLGKRKWLSLLAVAGLALLLAAPAVVITLIRAPALP